MKSPGNDRPGFSRNRRGIVVVVAAALAGGLGVVGVRAALVGGPSTLRTGPAPSVTVTPAPAAPAAVMSVDPAQPTPTASPAPDPTALADGIYPTFVQAVDVKGATVTVDVLQTFVGQAAHRAAIEDGVKWQDVMYNPVYIRNENPLLRTLPVARDVRILFFGVCDSPSRWAGLTRLRKEIRWGDGPFYYELTVVGDEIAGIEQKVAFSGC